jgi:hypothetical protein
MSNLTICTVFGGTVTVTAIHVPLWNHPLRRFWEQPPREEVLIDGTCAMMTQESFEMLAKYETSIPSGEYDGKMWRCGNTLCWYDWNQPGGIGRRKIVIV